MCVLGLGVIVLFLIEFKQIKESYNNPTSKSVGFFYENVPRFSRIVQSIKIMLFSTKTSNHIVANPQASSLFGGIGMGKVCSNIVGDVRQRFDYQANKPFERLRNKKFERVKEIKCDFV
jgi:hypothetical protein